MFIMSAFNKTWILAAGEDAALDECPLKFLLLIPALPRGTFIHWQISAGATGFFHTGPEYLQDREICCENMQKKASFGETDILIFVSHGMNKPFTF